MDHSFIHPLSANQSDTVRVKFYPDIAALESVWRHLETSGLNHPFQTYDWISCWQEHVGNESQVTPSPVLIESSDSSPLLILPLGIQKRGAITCLIWLGGELADYQTAVFGKTSLAVFTKENLYTLWESIQKELPPFDAILLEKQPATIAGKANPFNFNGSASSSCSAHSATLGDSLEAFLSSKRSKRWLSTDRRKERRLADSGSIEFVVATKPAEIAKLLPAMLSQKSRSYQEMGAQDLFAETGYTKFVSTLTEKLAPSSSVILCGLFIGERISATVWGLVQGNRYYYMLPTYQRDELARLSPGNLLLRHLFSWCISKNISTFDFTAGDEQYKEAWCDQTLPLYEHLSGITIRGHLFILKEKIFRALKLKIKNSPELFTTAKRLRSTLFRK
jgi:CelD/BcsL family acetyltransferase involved in cellulose biosynthesis